jgi:hypothetical protein
MRGVAENLLVHAGLQNKMVSEFEEAVAQEVGCHLLEFVLSYLIFLYYFSVLVAVILETVAFQKYESRKIFCFLALVDILANHFVVKTVYFLSRIGLTSWKLVIYVHFSFLTLGLTCVSELGF